jgi:hypothetical protein
MKRIHICLYLFLIIAINYSCENEEVPPTINTGSVSDITDSSATVSAEIISIGGSEITSYGHCWSISEKPTLSDFKSDNGIAYEGGVFTSNLTKLFPNTEYFIRAYASNSYGTSYGKQISFKTALVLCDYIDCESLEGFTTFVDKISPSSEAAWEIGLGYLGNGIMLNDNCYGGYIEFNRTLSNQTLMRFWTKSVNPGYSNITPEVFIDGIKTNIAMVAGSEEYTYWMQLETQSNILPGEHSIRIEFPHISTYYYYYLDEIEFWCQ